MRFPGRHHADVDQPVGIPPGGAQFVEKGLKIHGQ
jgi:hypothetical protein